MASKLDVSVNNTIKLYSEYVPKEKLKPNYLKRPPVKFLLFLYNAILKKTGFSAGLVDDAILQIASSKTSLSKTQKLQFLTRLINFVGLCIRKPIPVYPRKIAAGLQVGKTNMLLQFFARCANQRDNKCKQWESAVKMIQNGENPDMTGQAYEIKKQKEEEERLRKEKEKERRADEEENEEEEEEEIADTQVVNQNEVSDSNAAIEEQEKTGDESINHGEEQRLHEEKLERQKKQELARLRKEKEEQERRIKREKEVEKENERRKRLAEAEERAQRNMKSPEQTDEAVESSMENNPSESIDNEGHRTNSRNQKARPTSRTATREIRRIGDGGIITRHFTESTENVGNYEEGVGGDEDSSERYGSGRIMEEEEGEEEEGEEEEDEDEERSRDDQDQGSYVLVHGNNQKLRSNLEVGEEEMALTKKLKKFQEKENAEKKKSGRKGGDMTQSQVRRKEFIFGRKKGEDGRKRDHKNDIEVVRKGIQNICESTNPLGKSMDFIQEDLDSMKMELKKWRSMSFKYSNLLNQEKRKTDLELKSLKDEFFEINQNIENVVRKIHNSKASILRNEKKMENILKNVVN